jgi:iron complex transport system ATP-binding protein
VLRHTPKVIIQQTKAVKRFARSRRQQEPPAPPLIELNDATVVRESVAILDRISLSIRAGEHTAVIGPNGSGKSTLIKLLTAQIYPLARPDDAPPVRIFGRERWNLSELRGRMGIVSPDFHHRFVSGSSMGHVTGIEAVIASHFASEILFFHHEVTMEMRARSLAALELVDSAALANRPMHRMSTGEVRRVLIARALVHGPRLLILDEPTTGLDLVGRHDFLTRLGRLARSGTTLILVTHHVEEIIPEIERVILLAEGRVAEDGPIREVLTSAALSRVYGASLSLRRHRGRYDLRLVDDLLEDRADRAKRGFLGNGAGGGS